MAALSGFCGHSNPSPILSAARTAVNSHAVNLTRTLCRRPWIGNWARARAAPTDASASIPTRPQAIAESGLYTVRAIRLRRRHNSDGSAARREETRDARRRGTREARNVRGCHCALETRVIRERPAQPRSLSAAAQRETATSRHAETAVAESRRVTELGQTPE